MKTQEQTSKSGDRAIAETVAGNHGRAFPAPSFQVAKGEVLQRSPIFIDKTMLPGSKEEDSKVFWEEFDKKYGGLNYYIALSEVMGEIDSMELMDKTEWDVEIYKEASKIFAEDAEYVPVDELSKEQGMMVKSILTGKKESEEKDVPISSKDINKDKLGKLVEMFKKYAVKELNTSKKADDEKVDLTSEKTEYDTILQRAIFEICEEYGIKIAHGAMLSQDATGFSNLNNAKLKHGTTRFNESDNLQKENASTLAVFWVMSSEKTFQKMMNELYEYHHKSFPGTVLKAYADEVIEMGKSESGVKEILSQLAEVRLKWGPITYGKNIHIQANTDKMSAPVQWDLYQTLIHEALHSAEHPAFSKYLETYVPEGLQSNIKEGIVEYLTMKIWGKVLNKVEVTKDGVKPPATPRGGLSVSKVTKNKMISSLENGISSYDFQMNVISEIVNALKDEGTVRLEAAYFYGNLGALIPKDL